MAFQVFLDSKNYLQSINSTEDWRPSSSAAAWATVLIARATLPRFPITLPISLGEVLTSIATLSSSDDGNVAIEVRTSPNDMGRVIGKRGRVARAIRTVAQAAADEEGLQSSVEFID